MVLGRYLLAGHLDPQAAPLRPKSLANTLAESRGAGIWVAVKELKLSCRLGIW